jgi:hypothetical protein
MLRLLSLVVFSLSLACAPEVEPDAKPSQAPTNEPPSKPDSTPATGDHITVTASEAATAGLPELGFSLRTAGGMSGTRLTDGRYLHLSGPPGGPLSLSISPATIDAELTALLGDRIGSAKVVTEQVELLGASRAAVAWITGESQARTSWCALIVGHAGAQAGDAALLIELGVGHQGDAVTCKTALEHPTLEAVVESLVFD